MCTTLHSWLQGICSLNANRYLASGNTVDKDMCWQQDCSGISPWPQESCCACGIRDGVRLARHKANLEIS